MTFDGSTSHVLLQVDRTKFGFGNTASVQFRTRAATCLLLLLQFVSLSGGLDKFVEIRLYQGHLQVYSSFSQSEKVTATGLAHYISQSKK